MRRLPLLVLLLALLGGCRIAEPVQDPADDAPARWWKGNLHTHSLWSDGDDFPESIVGWYEDQGYDFIALSDHNTLAEGERWIPVEEGGPREEAYRAYVEAFGDDWVEERQVDGVRQVRLKTLAEYRTLFEEPGEFLVIQSEEISDRFEDKPLHVNVTNVREKIEPQGGESVADVLQNNIDAVRAQRERTGQPMFPHVNHPNFGFAVTAEDLIALEGERFFEVYNGHPYVHNHGDDHHPSTERLWDIVLTERLAAGRPPMFGLATDDSHHYFGFGPDQSNPGRGWVMVRADTLSPDALIDAMEAGEFYATTGVLLDDVRLEDGRLTVDIRAEEGVSYRTRFVGTRRGYDPATEARVDAEGSPVTRRYSDDVGAVLAEATGPNPSYELQGDELYVRAVVTSSEPQENAVHDRDHERAWTQPVAY